MTMQVNGTAGHRGWSRTAPSRWRRRGGAFPPRWRELRVEEGGNKGVETIQGNPVYFFKYYRGELE